MLETKLTDNIELVLLMYDTTAVLILRAQQHILALVELFGPVVHVICVAPKIRKYLFIKIDIRWDQIN